MIQRAQDAGRQRGGVHHRKTTAHVGRHLQHVPADQVFEVVGDAVAGVAPAVDRRRVDGGQLQAQAPGLGLRQGIGLDHGLEVRCHARRTGGCVGLADQAVDGLEHLIGGEVDQAPDGCLLQLGQEAAENVQVDPVEHLGVKSELFRNADAVDHCVDALERPLEGLWREVGGLHHLHRVGKRQPTVPHQYRQIVSVARHGVRQRVTDLSRRSHQQPFHRCLPRCSGCNDTANGRRSRWRSGRFGQAGSGTLGRPANAIASSFSS